MIEPGHIGGRIRSELRRLLGELRLSDYLAGGTLDAAPPARSFIGDADYQWWLNNKESCCTVAALYHRRQLLAGQTGDVFAGTDAEVQADYLATGDGTDDGRQLIDVLTRAVDVGIAGMKISGKARVDVGDPDEMRAALNLFGCVYVGGELPVALDTQGYTWTIPPPAQRTKDDEPDPDRGHAFLLGGYDRSGWQVVTWASGKYRATNEWVAACVDEAWVIIDDALATGARAAPNGFDLARLRADLAAIT